MSKLSGNITISRTSSSVEPFDSINIRIADDASGVQFVELRLSLDDFAKLICGQSNIHGDMIVRGLENIGMVREVKTEDVLISTNCSYDERPVLAAQAIKSLEVDGWVGRLEDAANSHRMIKYLPEHKAELSSITFVRFVDKEES